MDNLEYFHGPLLVNPGKINEEGKQCDKLKSEVDQRSNQDPINTDIKHMPMPPTNTNFKAISAAALVASRRKVIMKYHYRIVNYILKCMAVCINKITLETFLLAMGSYCTEKWFHGIKRKGKHQFLSSSIKHVKAITQ